MSTTTKLELKSTYQKSLAVQLFIILGCLLGIYITGVAMTSLGLPKEAVAGNTLWHVLFPIHMVFLIIMVLSALSVLITAFVKVHRFRLRAVIGIVAMVCAAISGSLSFNGSGAFKSATLFLVGMLVLVIASIYGSLLIKQRQ